MYVEMMDGLESKVSKMDGLFHSETWDLCVFLPHELNDGVFWYTR